MTLLNFFQMTHTVPLFEIISILRFNIDRAIQIIYIYFIGILQCGCRKKLANYEKIVNELLVLKLFFIANGLFFHGMPTTASTLRKVCNYRFLDLGCPELRT